MEFYDQNDVKELLQAIRDNAEDGMVNIQFIADELEVLGYFKIN